MTREYRKHRDKALTAHAERAIAILTVELGNGDGDPALLDALYDSASLCLANATKTNAVLDLMRALSDMRGQVDEAMQSKSVMREFMEKASRVLLDKHRLDAPMVRSKCWQVYPKLTVLKGGKE